MRCALLMTMTRVCDGVAEAPRELDMCVLVVGNDGVSLASGVHHYLKYVANCSVSWWGDQLSALPEAGPIPAPPSPIRRTTTYQHRYYMNVCTLGYSTFAWCVQSGVGVVWTHHWRQGLGPMGARD